MNSPPNNRRLSVDPRLWEEGNYEDTFQRMPKGEREGQRDGTRTYTAKRETRRRAAARAQKRARA